MLKKRLIGAATILAPVFFLMWLDDQSVRPGAWLLPLILVAGTCGSQELVGLMLNGELSVSRLPVLIGTLLLLTAACVQVFYPFPAGCPMGSWGTIAAAIMAATWVIIIDEMRRFTGPGGAVQRMALGLFSVIYVALPICFLIQLRLLHPNRLGLFAVISVIFVVKVADSGAYFAGRLLGKHKMAPTLSPKKTWEGAIGAVVSAMFAAAIFSLWVIPRSTGETNIGWFPALLYGVGLGTAGMVGDLGESLLKRDVAQKDSADWLPGLGGVLDMLDSLLLAAPVGYLFWVGGILG